MSALVRPHIHSPMYIGYRCGYVVEHTSLYGPTPICALDTPPTRIGDRAFLSYTLYLECVRGRLNARYRYRSYGGLIVVSRQ